jgi:hypothetical protein
LGGGGFLKTKPNPNHKKIGRKTIFKKGREVERGAKVRRREGGQ